MVQTAGFSSLSPKLLARKGGARPAMRSQVIPLDHLHHGEAYETEDDLGWNDMGDDRPDGAAQDDGRFAHSADVVPIAAAGMQAAEEIPADIPAVLEQHRALADRFASEAKPAAKGRRAAFTLRLDADRHLQLRLASTVLGRSAQAFVTEALDRHLATMPELAELAGKIRNRD